MRDEGGRHGAAAQLPPPKFSNVHEATAYGRMLKVPPWRCHNSLPRPQAFGPWPLWALQRSASAAQAPVAAHGAAVGVRQSRHMRCAVCHAAPYATQLQAARGGQEARGQAARGARAHLEAARRRARLLAPAAQARCARLRPPPPLRPLQPHPPAPPPPPSLPHRPLLDPSSPLSVPRACAGACRVSPPAAPCIHPAYTLQMDSCRVSRRRETTSSDTASCRRPAPLSTRTLRPESLARTQGLAGPGTPGTGNRPDDMVLPRDTNGGQRTGVTG